MKTVITKDGQTLRLADKPLGAGGSGEVYSIVSPSNMTHLCVKIYKPEHRTAKLAQKIDHQVKHPPNDMMGLTDFVLCWPTQSVFDAQKNFIGFVMPKAFADSISLKMLSTAKVPNAAPDAIKQQFDRSSLEGGLHRLKLCVHLAHAVHKLHHAGYVVIDLKPENFMVTPLGGVSVLDLDNVQVSDVATGKLLFHAELATIDYQPAEGLSGKINPQKAQVSANWDYFSLALMFYQILYGIHPYRASFKPPYDNIQSEHKAIQAGLYVHGSKSRFVDGKQPAHDKVLKTPKALQMLFMRAFDIGHEFPEKRPNAQEFGRIFFETHNYIKDHVKKNSTAPIKSQTPQSTGPRVSVPPPALPAHLADKFAKPANAQLGTSQSIHQVASNQSGSQKVTVKTSTQLPPKPNPNRVTFPSKAQQPKRTSGWAVAFWILLVWVLLGLFLAYSGGIGLSKPPEMPAHSVSDESFDEDATRAAADAAAAVIDSGIYESSVSYDSINRNTHAPNGMRYPDGAGHVEGYQKLNMEGHSIVTILNDKNPFTVFGKLVFFDPEDGYEVDVRTFYIPPYGGLNLRDLNAGLYELRLEYVGKNQFAKTDQFSLKDYHDGTAIRYTHLTIKLYNDGLPSEVSLYSSGEGGFFEPLEAE